MRYECDAEGFGPASSGVGVLDGLRDGGAVLAVFELVFESDRGVVLKGWHVILYNSQSRVYCQ